MSAPVISTDHLTLLDAARLARRTRMHLVINGKASGIAPAIPAGWQPINAVKFTPRRVKA